MTYFGPYMKSLIAYISALFLLTVTATSAFTHIPRTHRNYISSFRVRAESEEQSQAKSSTTVPTLTTPTFDINSETLSVIGSRLQLEVSVLVDSVKSSYGFIQSKNLAKDIAAICDDIDAISNANDDNLFMEKLRAKEKCLRFTRRTMLANLMKEDYETYVTTAEFLSPGRIPRSELPNVQDVKVTDGSLSKTTIFDEETGLSLVADCELENKVFKESLLDKTLLKIFRDLVVKETNGVGISDKPGIEGLLEQGRKFMLKPNQTSGM